MPIPVVCPGCSSKLNAPDGAAGKKVKCPKCAGPITIPAPAASADFEVVDDEPAPPPKKPAPAPAPAAKPPAKAAVVVDDDDEEDEKPKKKPAKAVVEVDDDEEEEKPKKKAKVVVEDDEDDEKPKKKKAKAVVEDDDEDEKPRKKKRAAAEDEDDEDEDRPKKKKKKRKDDEEEPSSLVRNIIGGVVLIILLVVLFFVFKPHLFPSDDDKKTSENKTNTDGGNNVPPPGGPIVPGPGPKLPGSVNWQAFTTTDKSLRIRFPSTLRPHDGTGGFGKLKQSYQINGESNWAILILNDGVAKDQQREVETFVGGYVELPKGMTDARMRDFKNAISLFFFDLSTNESSPGKIVKEEVTVAGRVWEEEKVVRAKYSNGSGGATLRYTVVGERVYILIAKNSLAPPTASTATSFFESFELLK